MLNIKPVSELRNYNKLLSQVKPDEPVFLTKNGYGKYAIVEIDEYEKLKNSLALLKKLQHAEKGPFHDFDKVSKSILK